jgi:hypothetical protein
MHIWIKEKKKKVTALRFITFDPFLLLEQGPSFYLAVGWAIYVASVDSQTELLPVLDTVVEGKM